MNQDFKKMKERLISCSLLLSLMLSGCGEKDNSKKVYVGNNNKNEIVYANGVFSGSITSDCVDKYVKIVTMKRENVVFTKLMAIQDTLIMATRGPSERNVKYIDLDTSTTLISYSRDNYEGATTYYSVGENLEIISEKDFLPYLYQKGIFQDDYDIGFLISFYRIFVEPTLESEEEMTLN